MRNVPKLRFKEFSGDWEEIKLKQILEFKNGINASKEQYGKGIKFINVLDILNNDFITYDNIIGKVDIDEKLLDKYSVNYGDILFQRSSETREEVGMANVYLDNKIATFGGFVIRGKKIGNYVPTFINKVLKTNLARNEITSKAGGSTRYNVGQDILNEVRIIIPNIQEQQKIADFLSSVDKKISITEEKLDLFKKYKKGIMQKIFKQELRFKDSNGNDYPEWEEKKLGELCKITTGKLDANAMVENGKYRFYTCAREFYFINNYAFDTEALLISGNGANVGYIHYYKGKFNAYQRTYVLDKFYENIIFIKYVLERNLKQRIEKEKNSGNTPYIVLSVLTDMDIQLPCLEEQQKIANFLSSIDKKIDNLAAELEDLKEFKKGLLQQMFV